MNKIVLYSTGCPQCAVLKKMLDEKNVEYTTCSDIKEMRSKGILSVPMLELDGEIMNLQAAMQWVREVDV